MNPTELRYLQINDTTDNETDTDHQHSGGAICVGTDSSSAFRRTMLTR